MAFYDGCTHTLAAEQTSGRGATSGCVFAGPYHDANIDGAIFRKDGYLSVSYIVEARPFSGWIYGIYKLF